MATNWVGTLFPPSTPPIRAIMHRIHSGWLSASAAAAEAAMQPMSQPSVLKPWELGIEHCHRPDNQGRQPHPLPAPALGGLAQIAAGSFPAEISQRGVSGFWNLGKTGTRSEPLCP